MTELLAVVTITLLAVISPDRTCHGVAQQPAAFRRAGVLTACGIGAGVVIHVSYTVGVGVLIQQSLWLFTVLKAIGAAYLIYLGVGMLRHAGAAAAAPSHADTAATSDFAALKIGF